MSNPTNHLTDFAQAFQVTPAFARALLVRTFQHWHQVKDFEEDPERLAEYAQRTAQAGGLFGHELERDLAQARFELIASEEKGDTLFSNRREERPYEFFRPMNHAQGNYQITVFAFKSRDDHGDDQIKKQFTDLQSFAAVHQDILLADLAENLPEIRSAVDQGAHIEIVLQPTYASGLRDDLEAFQQKHKKI